jgi:hypothetical protein
MNNKILFLCLLFLSPFCFSQQTQDKISLVCDGTDSGYEIDFNSGKKTNFNETKTKTYQISNGKYRNRICKITEKSIWCHEKGEGPVMGDSYLIRHYDLTIDRYSGVVKDYVKENMNFRGDKTELVKTFEGVCNKVTEKKF